MKNKEHKIYTLTIGRFQCEVPHEGHIKLIRSILNEGKNVCIALRKEDGTKNNPYTQKQRKEAFKKIFWKEILEEKVIIEPICDIDEIAYGRSVGYKFREIRLDKETEKISATKIRKQNEIKKN